jgi:hypothetical protein
VPGGILKGEERAMVIEHGLVRAGDPAGAALDAAVRVNGVKVVARAVDGSRGANPHAGGAAGAAVVDVEAHRVETDAFNDGACSKP